MPHINRIRVNNVKYNFGTQFYDDFVLRFSGKIPYMIWQTAEEKCADAASFAEHDSKLYVR